MQGREPFVSHEGLEQLHRFLFVLGITHVLYSCLAVALAMGKVSLHLAPHEYLLETYSFSFHVHGFFFVDIQLAKVGRPSLFARCTWEGVLV